LTYILGGKNETLAQQRTADYLGNNELACGLKPGLEPDPDSSTPTKAAHAHAAPEGNANTAAHFHAYSDAHPDPHGDAYQLVALL